MKRNHFYWWFTAIFLLFVLIVVAIQLDREKRYKVDELCAELNAYARMCDAYMQRTGDTLAVAAILPDSLRFTLIEENGSVQFDNLALDPWQLPNHSDRPEIIAASEKGSGYAIRASSSMGCVYLYYALRSAGNDFIRVAMPYEVTFRDAISKETLLIYALTLLLIVSLMILFYYRDRMGKKILLVDEQLEVSMRQADLQRERTRQLKKEMTNNISHELKTPVSSIRGFLEILNTRDNIPEEKKRFFIERAYIQTLRLSDLINDISLITKLEEADKLFPREEVFLHEVVEEAVAELEPALSEAGMTLTDAIPEDLLLPESNHSLLFAIFRNLIENAVSYAGKGSRICIEQELPLADGNPLDEGLVHLVFYDTGKGVPDAFLDKLFDRFERLDNGRDRRTGGTGLGLAIVKHAVGFHFGTIVARNRPEGGLAFYFTLSCRPSSDEGMSTKRNVRRQ